MSIVESFWKWIRSVFVDVWRLKWPLAISVIAIMAMDSGWLKEYAKFQLIVYKVSVCAIAVVFDNVVWAGRFPYMSLTAITKKMKEDDTWGRRDSEALLAVCILRGAVFVAIVYAITLGL